MKSGKLGHERIQRLRGLTPEASRLLIQRAAESGLDFLVVGDHLSFHGGQGFDGIVSATLGVLLVAGLGRSKS